MKTIIKSKVFDISKIKRISDLFSEGRGRPIFDRSSAQLSLVLDADVRGFTSVRLAR